MGSNITSKEKEALLKIFPGISEDSPCYIKPSKHDVTRLSLYYNETSIAILSKDMEIEYKEYIEDSNEL